MDEGVIKYHCHWLKDEPVETKVIQELMQWRDHLYSLGLIGVYDNGIGFGNISIRLQDSLEFVVSGTQTGHFPHLKPEYYTRVTEFNLTENSLTCRGPIKASSESLTHAAIYSFQSNIKAIIHIHHAEFWQNLLFHIPTTRPEVPYGTPQMVEEMFRLFEQEDLGDLKILAMAGHEEGVLTFGESLQEAGEVLFQYWEGG
ncbi:class II Aldolase and Adducin N-terminal domain protein [Lyngbya aestuarii BL J]|uniref:Class II Aldolase and Adducin N-terminal domain protein n=1 Tax=Lyngbya aestuarii BL J TaxID=1348334 RepID=U7QS34_9CYAN|nr:class II aldolase/adducin family protein [Lyngbya aestuarii]ERT09226.1 class II Aldolase and Adducin N-terminal domain protein [Lyngbya aestuarii BL J]